MRHALPDALIRAPLEAVRHACAQVAERARFVRIDSRRLERYAGEIPLAAVRETPTLAFPSGIESRDALAAYVLTLNAVNFGSGYFPQLTKRPGLSGYRTLEAALRERFESAGPLSLHELETMDEDRCARLFGQSLAVPEIAELMTLFASAWRDLAELLGRSFEGSFSTLVDAAQGSAEALVRILLEMPLYRDVAPYQELSVPILKRAQLCAAELAPLTAFHDLARLTTFADNLVAHVLKTDGVLRYSDDLRARIERQELLPWGSEEEVEIRACELHAVEQLIERLDRQITAHQLDLWLWTRGGGADYKARPRHRTRCSFY